MLKNLRLCNLLNNAALCLSSMLFACHIDAVLKRNDSEVINTFLACFDSALRSASHARREKFAQTMCLMTSRLL